MMKTKIHSKCLNGNSFNFMVKYKWVSGLENEENTTVYKIVYSAVAAKPEVAFKSLKRLVGERGFEPPTPWSRTRFRILVKSVEIE